MLGAVAFRRFAGSHPLLVRELDIRASRPFSVVSVTIFIPAKVRHRFVGDYFRSNSGAEQRPVRLRSSGSGLAYGTGTSLSSPGCIPSRAARISPVLSCTRGQLFLRRTIMASLRRARFCWYLSFWSVVIRTS